MMANSPIINYNKHVVNRGDDPYYLLTIDE